MSDNNTAAGASTPATSLEDLARQQLLLQTTIDTVWLIVGSIFVVFLQAGFAFLEAGSVRAKNLKNILLKNVIDTSVGSIMWYFVGYAFAFGNGNAFIGYQNFALSGIDVPSTDLSKWLYSMAFAATAATIVSGALAERCRFEAYVVYTMFTSGLIYPIAAHWMWSEDGWLSHLNPSRAFPDSNGLLDFAGSGTVHATGGMLALVGASWLGPRKGRFNSDGSINSMPGHSAVMATMGTLILWTGWYGFNSVTTQVAVGQMPTASLAVVNTNLSAAAGSVSASFISYMLEKKIDLFPVINGILAGLVASSSTCAYVNPYAALVIGLFAGAIYMGISKLMLLSKIDDPLDAVAVHLGGGLWGVFAAGLFAVPHALEAAGFPRPEACGAFYGCGGYQLGIQVLGMVVLTCWALAISTLMFFPLRRLGILRVSTSQEMEGLDVTFHGGNALYMGTHMGSRLSTINTVTSHQQSLTSNELSSLTAHPSLAMRKSNGSSLRGASNYKAVMSHASIPDPSGKRNVSNDDVSIIHSMGGTRNTSNGSRDGKQPAGKAALRKVTSDVASHAELSVELSSKSLTTTTQNTSPQSSCSGQHGDVRKPISRKHSDQ